MSRKILILDDEPDILQGLKNKLDRSGYSVTAVTNGLDGLAAARHERFDAVISDIVMPGMDGFHFLQEFKKLPGCENIPVVIVSAHPSMEDTFRVFGIQDFLLKPVNAESIVRVIESILHPPKKRHRSVVILGADREVMTGMVHLLNDHGWEATAARDESEFLTCALVSPPDMILIDVMLPKLLAHEMISALRCFSQFKSTVILTYTHFSEKQMTNVDAIEQLKFSKNQCAGAGATDYIGRFSRLTFLEMISKY